MPKIQQWHKRTGKYPLCKDMISQIYSAFPQNAANIYSIFKVPDKKESFILPFCRPNHIIENPEFPWSEPTQRSFISTLCPETDAHTEQYYEYLDKYAGTNAITPPLCSMSFNTTDIANEVAAVNQVISNYAPILNVGIAEDVDAFYSEYMEALDKAGYQKVLGELLVQAQAYYDSFN